MRSDLRPGDPGALFAARLFQIVVGGRTIEARVNPILQGMAVEIAQLHFRDGYLTAPRRPDRGKMLNVPLYRRDRRRHAVAGTSVVLASKLRYTALQAASVSGRLLSGSQGAAGDCATTAGHIRFRATSLPLSAALGLPAGAMNGGGAGSPGRKWS